MDQVNKVIIHWKDFSYDEFSNTVPITITSDNMNKTSGLPGKLTVAIRANVMNTKHIDIPDLLFNGVIGNVAPTREAKEAATPIL